MNNKTNYKTYDGLINDIGSKLNDLKEDNALSTDKYDRSFEQIDNKKVIEC